jgi:hypothetical protein
LGGAACSPRPFRSFSSGRAGVSTGKQHPALARFDEPFELVEYLASKGGDLDEKDRLLGTLVTLVQRREHHELVSALLWLGLWPGLDAVYRRRQRNFRDSPTSSIAELADVFTGIIERLDLTGGSPRGRDARAQHRARPHRSPPRACGPS